MNTYIIQTINKHTHIHTKMHLKNTLSTNTNEPKNIKLGVEGTDLRNKQQKQQIKIN